MGSAVNRVGALAIAFSIATGCGAAAPVPSGAPTPAPTSAAATASAQPSPSATPDIADSLTLVEFASTTDPSAAAEREHQLTQDLREEAGMAALIGDKGALAFGDIDALAAEYAQDLIAVVAAAIDAGELPDGEGSTAGMLASVRNEATAVGRPVGAIDVSLFADTGFTASALMTLYTGVVQRAMTDGSGHLPRQESFDQTSNGLRQQVDLSTTFIVNTGGGHVSADIIMSATARISDAATGSFIALYTSRTTGHFDVAACPDEDGVAEGTYTFETKHELNDVSSPTAARSGAGRAVNAPFQLIDGPEARLIQIEAAMDMQADAFGPGSATGPGPTAPFDWNASQSVRVVMPAAGSTTATGGALTVTGAGGERAAGSMFVSSAMAQLFLMQVAKEAESFWRSGECIEIHTTRESASVSPGEEVQFDATAKSKVDGQDIDAPIKGTFSGKESLDPDGEAQETPAHLTFTAGEEEGDKGTIALEQVGVRGIGKKTIEFTVGPRDFRWNLSVPALGGMSGQKCDGPTGDWTVVIVAPGSQGQINFTLAEGATTGAAHMVLDFSGAGTVHWELSGQASFVEGDPPMISLGTLTGTATASAFGQTVSTPTEQLPFTIPLEQGDFCA